MTSTLKAIITEDMKSAMRAKDKATLGTIRLLLAAIKQQEVDGRVELTDANIVDVVIKMIKQRKESIAQYEAANRSDLADIEKQEIEHLKPYMPEALSDNEISELIADAMEQTGASSMQDMGKVMGILKPKLAGRADMAVVSQRIKAQLV